jgi:hypothetical protein
MNWEVAGRGFGSRRIGKTAGYAIREPADQEDAGCAIREPAN